MVARWTGIPVSRLLEGETEKLLHMEDRLHERVVGQDEAIEAVATALRRSRAGLSDPDRPIGTFLFLGPTGVGKTELARALAEFMFDTQEAMIRIDMSEYMEKHSVSRLVGAPPGYVGYEEGGQLTEAVRRRPYSVVLLDEIEKAHGDVFNTLLQVMDDGRLTDGQGRTVDFKNTVLIMTSNIPVPEGLGDAELRSALLEYFKPEFINRLDDVVRFHALDREQLSEIVDLQVALVIDRVAERGVQVTLTDTARVLLANLGYDPSYGARPLRRVIQKQLTDRLALALLEGEIHSGDDVTVDARDGELVLEKGPVAAARGRLSALSGGRPRGAAPGRPSSTPARPEPLVASQSVQGPCRCWHCGQLRTRKSRPGPELKSRSARFPGPALLPVWRTHRPRTALTDRPTTARSQRRATLEELHAQSIRTASTMGNHHPRAFLRAGRKRGCRQNLSDHEHQPDQAERPGEAQRQKRQKRLHGPEGHPGSAAPPAPREPAAPTAKKGNDRQRRRHRCRRRGCHRPDRPRRRRYRPDRRYRSNRPDRRRAARVA